MDSPIVIVSMPRSGSSMIAGALAAHGVWTGTCRPADEHNPRGYFEHLGIADLIGRMSGHRVNMGVPAQPSSDWPAEVERVIRADGYEDGPWLWKGSAMYAPLWGAMRPTWVVLRRDLDRIKRSGQRSKRYGARPRSVRAHLKIMDELTDCCAIEIRTRDVVAGDYSGVGRVLERVGLTLDEDVMNEWVDPRLWTA